MKRVDARRLARGSRSASSIVKRIWASFDCEYARAGFHDPSLSSITSPKSIGAWPIEETLTIRLPGVCLSTGSSSSVIRKCDR